MIVIGGCIIVIGCVLAGFVLSGGHIHALIHPAEILTIGGAAGGAMVIMSSKKILIDLFKGVLHSLKGSPYDKAAYGELFKMMFDLMQIARREGLLALESHLADPHHSTIFNKYPKIAANHHVMEFICGALIPVVEGTAKPDQLPALMDAEMRCLEDEHHAPIMVLSKTTDALPGFGIVAAVLGIVITMGAIDGPVEEIGHKVGAALVGTFLGILASYGFFGPMVGRMEMLGHEEMAYFRTIASIITGFVNDLNPKVAIDMARRGVATDRRPNREELDALFKEASAA
ncbi:MAG: flagellar motor stator protein MotA [Planctomycetia bacterium]|nr:flagellar motor stator protein MotA [Planctomycetia bacterium]